MSQYLGLELELQALAARALVCHLMCPFEFDLSLALTWCFQKPAVAASPLIPLICMNPVAEKTTDLQQASQAQGFHLGRALEAHSLLVPLVPG